MAQEEPAWGIRKTAVNGTDSRGHFTELSFLFRVLRFPPPPMFAKILAKLQNESEQDKISRCL